MKTFDFVIVIGIAIMTGIISGILITSFYLDKPTKKVVRCEYIVDPDMNPRKVCE